MLFDLISGFIQRFFIVIFVFIDIVPDPNENQINNNIDNNNEYTNNTDGWIDRGNHRSHQYNQYQ